MQAEVIWPVSWFSWKTLTPFTPALLHIFLVEPCFESFSGMVNLVVELSTLDTIGCQPLLGLL